MKLNHQTLLGGLVATAAVIGSAYAQFSVAPLRTAAHSDRMARTVDGRKAPDVKGDMPDMAKAIHKAPAREGEADLFKPVIYGMLLYSDEWYDLGENESIPYGCYAFSPNYPQKEAMLVHPNLYANGGGCYSNHRVHFRLYSMDAASDAASFLNYFQCINTDNWSYVADPVLTTEDNTIANDMTYDRTTGRIYAAVWGNFDGGNTRLATVDPLTGATVEIATLPDLVCLAANNYGELYGVERVTGVMYRIDKETGSYIKVGNTGVSATYMQSATVDPETNKIYWVASHTDDTSAIYELNTTTGGAVKRADFPNSEEFSCVFIEADTKGLNAPGEVTGLKIVSGGSASTATFTAPAKAFDGSALSGNVTVELFCDGVSVGTKSVKAGENVSMTFTPGAGQHTVLAFASNSVGEGPKTFVEHWTGADLPAAPGNVALSVTDNKAVLTWNTPDAGLHGGTINPDDVTYTIRRYPGGNMVAQGFHGNRFTETLPAEIANYYYTVTACLDDEEGGTATSNSWFAGETFTVPYFQGFDNAEGFNGFTSLDLDGDGYGWEYKDQWKAVSSRFNSTEQQSDWLITPPITFKANSTYLFSMKARAFDSDSPERFEVLMGASPNTASMTKVLIPAVQTANTDYVTYSGSFTTEADGVLYFGIHCISFANSYRLIIDDIEVRLTASSDVPAAVSNLKAVAGGDGNQDVTLSFTTPDKTHSGSALKSLKSVSIYRGESNAPVKVFENPAVGATMTWTDDMAPQGNLTYRVLAANENGNGIESTVTVYAGFDIPAAVSNIKLAYGQDGKCTLTWDAPATGQNGAALDSQWLTYEILRSDGSKAADEYTGTVFVDDKYVDADEQKMVYYQITAINGGVRGASALADYVIVGPDMTLPFAESFTDKGLDNTPWIISRVTNHTDMMWTLNGAASNPDATPFDGDGGLATFVAYDREFGLMERMTSPKLDLFSAQHPVIKFRLYHTTASAAEKLAVQVRHNDTDEIVTLKEIGLKSDHEGWTEYVVEIPRKECREGTSIAFMGTSARGFNIHIDAISVENGEGDLTPYDLEAVSLEVPALVPDREASIKLTVYNNGSERIDNYSVALLVNGAEAITANSTEPIEAGDTYFYIFKLTPETADLNQTFRFKGRVKCSQDTVADNNETDEVAVTVGVSGVDEIVSSDAVDVYTLDGMLLMKGAGIESIDNLPAGIYIVNGQKVMVK